MKRRAFHDGLCSRSNRCGGMRLTIDGRALGDLTAFSASPCAPR